jgi:hypothetical protein
MVSITCRTIFCSNEEYSNELLQKFADVIKQHNLTAYQDDYLYYKELYIDWWRWEKEGSGESFAQWCVVHNKEYAWVKAFYYEENK